MSVSEGISVIVCSIHPEMAKDLQGNILSTCGVDTEFIIIDNRHRGLSITAAYNEGAAKAKYDFLLFTHEDVKWMCGGWGSKIIAKLKEKNTGAIGMAGSDIRLDAPSFHGWTSIRGREITNYINTDTKHKRENDVTPLIMFRQGNRQGEKFRETVTLDGLTIFTRKEVWEKIPFDEKMVTGFHGYDIDFALSLNHNGFHNFVWTDPEIYLWHFSKGSYDHNWYEDTLRLHNEKWHFMLPALAGDAQLTEAEMQEATARCAFDFLKKGAKLRSIPDSDLFALFKDYSNRYGFSSAMKNKFMRKYLWYRYMKKG
ncbi:MAG: hypothetical protein J1F16_04465 [Muribaculaceae bacterium]|nr:hypothetical protein [Muribaculaceae bacterium]